ncbi:hypothetical protein JCM19992_18770 [Thermostilla marina]
MSHSRRSVLRAGLGGAISIVGIGEGRASVTSSLDELGDIVKSTRRQYALPAMGAALVLDGKPVGTAVSGVRKWGSQEPVAVSDPFHLGSCTKAMTATMLAVLVHEAKLRPRDTLGELLGHVLPSLHDDYRPVTISDLLTHRGGCPKDTLSGFSLGDVHRFAGPTSHQRLELARRVLTRPAPYSRGTFHYSNCGYALAATCAEQVTGRSWEQLMREIVFEPLGMNSAGFGPMGTRGRIDAPWQHRWGDGKLIPVEPDRRHDNPPAMWPAGGVHVNLCDWAKFVHFHMTDGKTPTWPTVDSYHGELEGQGPHVKAAKTATVLDLTDPEVRSLHTPPAGTDYAWGWQIVRRLWAKGPVLTHAGTNTMNYAVVWCSPADAFFVLVVTNCGGDVAARACDTVAADTIRTFLK